MDVSAETASFMSVFIFVCACVRHNMFLISEDNFPTEQQNRATEAECHQEAQCVYCIKQCAENQGGRKAKQSFTV